MNKTNTNTIEEIHSLDKIMAKLRCEYTNLEKADQKDSKAILRILRIDKGLERTSCLDTLFSCPATQISYQNPKIKKF